MDGLELMRSWGYRQISPSFLWSITNMQIRKAKNVFVHAYVRVRFGRHEHVIQHWRSQPGQLAFAF
jgi:hypothetical protein